MSSIETDQQYMLPVTARFMAPDDESARQVAQGIYNAGGAVRAHINAEGVACSNMLLNTRTEEIERIGYYSEEVMNEARAALIEGADVESPSRLLIEKAALLIQGAREAAKDSDWETAAYETTDGHELTLRETLLMADDTPELYRWPLDDVLDLREMSAMMLLENVIDNILRKAVNHRLRSDAQQAEDMDHGSKGNAECS